MIKEIISELAYDKITLSQALTRAKLIANQVQDEIFKNWLSKELNGYDYDDKFLPSYRKIWSDIELTVEFPFGQIHTFPVVLDEDFDKRTKDMVSQHRVLEPIYIIEQNITEFKKPTAHLKLPAGLVQVIGSLYIEEIESKGGQIRRGQRMVGKAQFQNIIELTKQKLLDTLQDLEVQFPHIDKSYEMNKENKEKVQNIVTNNIYGNNNPTNIATGVNVELSVNYARITKDDESKLESFGVSKEEVIEIKQIVEQNSNDKSTLTSKAMKWLGSVSASVAGRGLYDKLPQLAEFVQNIIA